MDITKRQVVKHVMLPGIIPRVRGLLGSTLCNLAYLIAIVFNTVRILPKNHPYIRAGSAGKYSIRQVIAEASNHIEFSKKNIDQVVVFIAIISGLIILAMQFILFALAFAISTANAAMPATVADFFVTPNPQEDLAFKMLDYVFGVPNMFGSSAPIGTAFHDALQGLFEFYSYGILVVGAIIIIYSIITIVAETAVTGTPFGQRFNHAWVPVRLVLFFALLLPLLNGLNGGQYIVLHAAKLGSGLASTGWVVFNDSLEQGTYLGDQTQLVTLPNNPEITHMGAFMLVVKTCDWAYSRKFREIIQPYAVWGPGVGDVRAVGLGDTYQDISELSSGENFLVVFGVQDSIRFNGSPGNVGLLCGALSFRVTDVSEPGPAVIQQWYFNKIMEFWEGGSGDAYTPDPEGANLVAAVNGGDYNVNEWGAHYTYRYLDVVPQISDIPLPTEAYKEQVTLGLYNEVGVAIQQAVDEQRLDTGWALDPALRDLGWGGAAIWYNKVAQKNGALMSAVHNAPDAQIYPKPMEIVRQAKLAEDTNVTAADFFTPSYSQDTPRPFEEPGYDKLVLPMSKAYSFWETDGYRSDALSGQTSLTGNKLIDTINLVLGTEGLFEVCKNKDIHPLAQLSALGKSMLDRSIGSFTLAVGSGVGSIFAGEASASFTALSKYFSATAGIGLLVGFILFYILPFFPFIYFFFALGGWVKGIFEAMVAMPLWALAHLRVDGEGIPGDAAIEGYYLIFEIFIRPILIVFGLLAAIGIFTAMAKSLHDVFYMALTNLSGHDSRAALQVTTNTTDAAGVVTGTTTTDNIAARNNCFQDPAGDAIEGSSAGTEVTKGPVDEFFFTILYTILLYMIGSSCFKLIDLIPNQILRWMNIQTASFNDGRKDATEGLLMYASLGGQKFSGMGDSISKITDSFKK